MQPDSPTASIKMTNRYSVGLQDPVLRSEGCTEKVHIRFINMSNRVAKVIWVDYKGNYKRYRLLFKGDFVDVNTFTTHPWLAVDNVTKERLRIDGETVYYPKTPKDFIKKHQYNYLPTDLNEMRLIVPAVITSDLHSLKHTCLLLLSQTVKNPEVIEQLDLPKILTENLKRIVGVQNSEQEVLAL